MEEKTPGNAEPNFCEQLCESLSYEVSGCSASLVSLHLNRKPEQLVVSVKGEDMRKLPGQQVRAIYCYGGCK